MLKIINIVGARPNFIKIAPLLKEQKKNSKIIKSILIHTGQHYSSSLSDEIFYDLELPKPDIYLGVGFGTQSEQTGSIMIELEKIYKKERPDLVLVVGDVNSTLAATITAKKEKIKVAHVEAGLRSGNWDMSEEINRILVDRVSDFLFTTERSANINLKKEGINENKIFFVGNVMIDTLMNFVDKIEKRNILSKLNLKKKRYLLFTAHRAENVDDERRMKKIVDILENIDCQIVFPLHPRTKKRIDEFNLIDRIKKIKNLKLIDPLSYLDFLYLHKNSIGILTDSGGLQEEATFLGIPCLTLRDETERPITIYEGTNKLVSLEKELILKEIKRMMKCDKNVKNRIPEYWDGGAAKRIIEIIKNKMIL